MQDAGRQVAGDIRLRAQGVSKSFGPIVICEDINLELTTGDFWAIVGPNGAGKTTFVRMLAGLCRPDVGTIDLSIDGAIVDKSTWYRHIAMVAPDLALYEELTALENLHFYARVSGLEWNTDSANDELERFGLAGRAQQRVGEFSSGMKQRLKYVLAVSKKPAVLICDEPTANLDTSGKELIYKLLHELPMVVVIATNEAEEAALATHEVHIGDRMPTTD